MLEQLLTELLAGDNPLSWATLLVAGVYAFKVGIGLYQGHIDWKRKTTQEREDYQRKVESGQDEWQRTLIKDMFNQSNLNHQGVITILSKQTDVLSALQSAVIELKTIIMQQQSRRRTDFAKVTAHEQTRTDTLITKE